VRNNAPYAAFAGSLGYSAERVPPSWREIPAVPSAAFKEAVLTTFPSERAALVFETSGTTADAPGRHYFETPALYDAALLAGFDRFMLGGGLQPRRYLLLVPQRATSSLGYMMRTVARERGDGREGWYLGGGDELDVAGFCENLRDAARSEMPVCVAGTAFAFVALLDALERDGVRLQAPPGSLVMETGGFKGRTRAVAREDLYAGLQTRLGVSLASIVAEYGMTELTSQYYDAPSSRGRHGERVKTGPPWLRAVVAGADGREVAVGEIGALRHFDLANRGSVIAVQTEDLATRLGDGGFVLLGREPGARLRGCSLDAEDLIAPRR
jgi:hypothetical protein